MALTLKVGFPPGHPTAHSMIKVEPNASCDETLKSIAQKQNILNPDQYLLYMPGPSPIWLDKTALISAYPLKNQGLIEFKRRHQLVRIAGRTITHTLLLDVTRPLQEFMRWVAVKFLIDEADIPNWSLFNKGVELSLDKSVTQQSAESSFHFVLGKKGETPDLAGSHDSQNMSTPGSPSFLPHDDEESVLNGSSGMTRDRKDSVFDQENPDLQVPVKSLVNPQIEGWLKKLTTKKDWKKRYFVLKDKTLYYYSSPQDRKASGLISLQNYAAKPTNLQAKDAKYWAFELYSTAKVVPKSPRKENPEHTNFILRCENEQEMHTWLAAIRGDNAPKLAPQAAVKKPHHSKAGPPTPAVFAVDLIKSVPYGAELPSIIEQAIKYIDAKALDTVGIYRLSGAAPTIANWKKLFDKGEKVDLALEPDPHAVAGLMKLFLRELPEPILTFPKYDDFIAAISHTTKWAKVRAIRAVSQTITGINRNVLLYLLQHLRRVNAKCDINKMHLANLATVFGPTLLRKPSSGNEGTGFDVTVLTMVVDTPLINELCMSMIEDYEYIFADKVIPQSAMFARALYAYNGEDQNTELSFEAGSIIRVTQTGQKDQWWMGQILLSPTASFIGKSGCFPGSYVEAVSGTSADWISLSALYTLTEDVEANRGQIVGLQAKVEALTKANVEALKDKEESALKGEKKQKAIASAVGVNSQLSHLWEHMDELVKNLASYMKSTSLPDIESSRHAFFEELEQLGNHAKFKNKGDKENYAAKLETVRASLEAEKAARTKLSLTSSILLKDVEFIRNMLR